MLHRCVYVFSDLFFKGCVSQMAVIRSRSVARRALQFQGCFLLKIAWKSICGFLLAMMVMWWFWQYTVPPNTFQGKDKQLLQQWRSIRYISTYLTSILTSPIVAVIVILPSMHMIIYTGWKQWFPNSELWLLRESQKPTWGISRKTISRKTI